jgi:hypothetical protein
MMLLIIFSASAILINKIYVWISYVPRPIPPIPSSSLALLRTRLALRRRLLRTPWGVLSFRLGCGGGNINSGKRSHFSGALLLRLPEFIFPPPHSSLKERTPRGSFPAINLNACFA